MDNEAFKIYCRAFFPDCVFEESETSIWVYNNEMKEALELGYVDTDVEKFRFEKYGDLIVIHEPVYKELPTKSQFVSMLKKVNKYLLDNKPIH